MHAQILYRFPDKVLQGELPRAWYWQQGENDKLVVIFPLWKDGSMMLDWAEADLQRIKFKERSIPLHSVLEIQSLQLTRSAATNTWLVADLEVGSGNLVMQNSSATDYLVLRAIREDEDDPVLTPHLLFDDSANDMAVIGPLLALETQAEMCRIVYLKPEMDYVATPEITLAEITIPDGQIHQVTIGFAESALVCSGKTATLTLLCTPEPGSEDLSDKISKVVDFSTFEWRFSLMGGRDYTDSRWQHRLDMGIQVEKRVTPSEDLITGPILINATAIEGPTRLDNGLSTFVVGMIMMNTQDDFHDKYHITRKRQIIEQVDRLLCIDAEGQVLQTYQGSIGLYMGLCQTKNGVMGVDLFGNRWRLWRWRPLKQSVFDQIILLDQGVVRACLLTENEPGQNDCFWLIEEYRDRISISKHDAMTLEAVAPPVSLPDMHLLPPQYGYGRLDWHTEIDALIHQGGMLMLVADKDEQPLLYQIQ